MSALITEPGVYENISAADYHSDCVAVGSLSSTGAKRLLPPSCPAKFKHERDHGRPERNAFDLGHGTHTKVLGKGEPFVIIDAADYKTAKARDARDAAYAAGQTPLLPHELDAVDAMTRAVLNHPIAGALLEQGRGHRERVMVAQDPDTGVWLRSMVDADDDLDGIGPVIVDLKTAASAEPGAIAAAIERYGYHQQDPFYSDIYTTLFGVEPAFLFVFVEKEPPHPVTVYQLRESDRLRGRERNRKAIDLYAHCVAEDRWPGYSDDVVLHAAPGWAVAQHEAAWRRGDLDPTYLIGGAA